MRPTHRPYGFALGPRALHPDDVRPIIDKESLRGQGLEFQRIHVLLTIAIPSQRFNILTMLVGAGVPEDLVFEALRNLGQQMCEDSLDWTWKFDAIESAVKESKTDYSDVGVPFDFGEPTQQGRAFRLG